jgi:hypothetical protein
MLRPLPSFLVCTLLVAAGPARAATPPPALYPTDRCVAGKLSAAATACRQVFDALAFAQIDLRVPAFDWRLVEARKALAKAWGVAEAQSQDTGVDCAQTTATADEVFTKISDGATGIAAQVRSAVAGARFLKGIRAFGGIRAAGQGCWQIVGADGRHLLRRSHDRERVQLERERRLAAGWLEILLRWSALGKDGAAKVVASVKALSQNVVLANLVSPNVPSDFVMIEPSSQVSYQGKTLEPICSRGTPWVHFVRRGTVNKLLVYYQGGGACWDYLTCEMIKTFKETTGAGDNPANTTTGFADMSNPENPFRDWSVVFVPYCTGDVHWGDATVVHEWPGNSPVTIQHKGFVNAQVAEKWAREHFVNPDQVFVTGSSAGSYGAILNGAYLQEGVYPSSDFAVLGDAGNGVVPQAFLESQISKWGIANTMPKWIPALDKPVAELDASTLWGEAAKFYSTHRFANYAAAYDGGNGGQVGFYKVMLNPDSFFTWLAWWTASCDWNAGMRLQVTNAFAVAPANYRYYIGSGSRHTMWGHDKVYTDTTGGVPTIVRWVKAMLAGSSDWVNAETTDPGLLLPGDPRPSPAQPPYTAAGRIVCE